MDLALYHPQVGYYRQARRRVGRSAGTDFYTSTSVGAVFGELVVSACTSLLKNHDISKMTFVEIGAEPEGHVLSQVRHPFRAVQILPLGAPLILPPHCIVFSNELFDAQPFRRFIRRGSAWIEQGVAWDGARFSEVAREPITAPWLPPEAPDGFRFDAPRRSVALLHTVVSQPWEGLFLAADYGKSWQSLAEETAEGTARAYSHHQQSNDLFAQPGEQDLTCHVCWDWLWDELAAHHFTGLQLQSQEGFFIHNAHSFLAEPLSSETLARSPRKQALLQLLHPGNLGQKFQVLHGIRSS